MNFSTKKLALLLLFTCKTQSTTYEEIHKQVEQEANETIQQQNNAFAREYVPNVIKTSAMALLTGALIPFFIHAVKHDNLGWASFYSAFSVLFGYLTILQHAELMEDRRITNETMFAADKIYHKKLAHVHTRHYLQDIAKYLMDRLQKIVQTSPEAAPIEMQITTN